MSSGGSSLPGDLFLRLDRAEEHIERLSEEAAALFCSHSNTLTYRFIRKSDPQGRDDLLFIEPMITIPRQLALLVSDALHSLRSTLDNLAFALSHNPPADGHVRRIAFPIFTDKNDMRRFNNMTNWFQPASLAIVQRLQPYNTPSNWDNLQPYKPSQDSLLAVLANLSNLDKHRFLHTFICATNGYILDYTAPIYDLSLGILDDKSPIARIRSEMPLDYNPEIHFTPQLTVGISDRTTGMIDSLRVKNTPADQLLRLIASDIRDRIFPAFEPCFKGGVLRHEL